MLSATKSANQSISVHQSHPMQRALPTAPLVHCTSYDHLLSRRLQAPQCQCCLPCSSNSSANRHPLILRQMLQELLLCLQTQAIIVWQLIVVLSPNFRVSYTPAAHPDYRVVTTLQDCIGLLVIIRGFCLVDIPSDDTLSILCHDSLLEGFHLTL